MSSNRVPISLRLDPQTVKLIKDEEDRSNRNQTEVIEKTVTLVLNSPRVLTLLENASKKTGKTENKILEECILAELAPGRGGK